MYIRTLLFLVALLWAGTSHASIQYLYPTDTEDSTTVKILGIGTSIVSGAHDYDKLRPASPNAPHIPEGGWVGGGDPPAMSQRWPDAPGWFGRAGDFVQKNSVQMWNEGVGSSKATHWDPSGNNYIGQIFARETEPLPADLDYAIIALMVNDWATTPTATWKAQMDRIIDYLKNTKGIEPILVKDWACNGNTTQRDAYGTAVDELVTQYSLLPAIDIRTISEANFNGDKSYFNPADYCHPSTKGHAAAAKVVSDYLVAQGIASAGNCPTLDEKRVDDGNGTFLDLTTTEKACALEDLTGTGFNIGRVGVVAVVKNDPATKPLVNIGVQIGGTSYSCSRRAGFIGTDPYASYGCDWEESPATSSPWTISEINGMSLVLSESAADVTATQLYAIVETDEEVSSHAGVLIPDETFTKFGQTNTTNGHSWYASSDTDGYSPGGYGQEIFMWEGHGYSQDEGYYLGLFTAWNNCDTASTGFFAVAMRIQNDGDRYEVQVVCPTVQNQAVLKLVRYDDGVPTTLATSSEVTGSNVSNVTALLVKVTGAIDPQFVVSLATNANHGKYDDVLTYTDSSANAIEVAGRWGSSIKEDAATTDVFGGLARYYALDSAFGVKITGLPAGYSIKAIDYWGQSMGTFSESGGTAFVPWQGFVDYRFLTVTPTTSGMAGFVEGFMGQIQVLDGSENVKADTGLLLLIKYGQTWEYKAGKLWEYRIGAIEDSTSYSSKRRAKIWFQLDRPGTVTATCAPSCGNNSIKYTYADNLEFKQNEYINVLTLDNLEPGTHYSFSILVDDVVEGTGSFKTGPLNSSDVEGKACYSSCVAAAETPFYVADTIAGAGECDFFVFEGDTPYVDDPTEYAWGTAYGRAHWGSFIYIASMYKSYHQDPYWRKLFHTMPSLFTLSDHEYCNDWAQGADDNMIDERPGDIMLNATVCQGWPGEASEKAYRLYSQYGNPDSPTEGKFWYKLQWGKSSHYFPDQVRERTEQTGITDHTFYYGETIADPPGDPVTLTEPSFEGGTTGWTCDYGTCFRTTAQAHDGSYSYYVSGNTNLLIAQQPITVTANEEYTCKAWVRDDNTTSRVAGLRVRTESMTGGAEVCSVTDTASNINVWTELTCVVPDTNTDTSLYLQLFSPTGVASGNNQYSDHVSCTATGGAAAEPEVQPSCTRDGSDLSRLNCTGTTFTAEDPAFNTSRAMALFDGRWYSVSSVINNTALDMTEDISCTNCTGQTTRIVKDLKTTHGRDQLNWLLNSWRAETNPIQFFWSPNALFGQRAVSTGVFGFTSEYCLDGADATCGYGGEHDLLIDELEALEQTGKVVLMPVGDEHTVRFSKWSTFDIYELFVSGLSRNVGTEWPTIPTYKEAQFPGLKVVLDLGGEANWGLINYDTSTSAWKLEVRNDSNQLQGAWDGNKATLGTDAWLSAPRGLDITATAWKYPENAYFTPDKSVVKMSSGYCWKVGTNYDASNNKTVLRRSADTACTDWLSSSAYTYEISAASDNFRGQSIQLATDESALIVFNYTGAGKLKKCSFTGTPPTISSCSTPSGDPNYGADALGLLLDKNGYVYISVRYSPGTSNKFYIANSTSANSIEVGSLYQVDDGAEGQPVGYFGELVNLNTTTGDLMAMWYSTSDIIRARKCTAGANEYCEQGEWGAVSSLVTDSNITYAFPAKEIPDIASKGDGTAVIAYITKPAANSKERSALKYIYYDGSSWGSPGTISNAGWMLKDAQVFYGGDLYFVAAIDESLDKIVIFQSADGVSWSPYTEPVESATGKVRMKIDQISGNTIAVTYLAITEANNTLQTDEVTYPWLPEGVTLGLWGQTATQFWTYNEGKWRMNNVNPGINRSINRVLN